MTIGCFLKDCRRQLRTIRIQAWVLGLLACLNTVGWCQDKTRGNSDRLTSDPPVRGTTLLDRNSPGASDKSFSASPGTQHPSASTGTQKRNPDFRSIAAASNPEAAESAMRPKEPMQLPPLNKIEVRQASTSRLNSSLPAVARSENRESDYSPGSPYAMNGKVPAFAVAHQSSDRPVGDRPRAALGAALGDRPQAWNGEAAYGADGDSPLTETRPQAASGDRPLTETNTAHGGMARTPQVARPQVARRPLPSREDITPMENTATNQDSAEQRLAAMPPLPSDPPSLPDPTGLENLPSLPYPTTVAETVSIPMQAALPSPPSMASSLRDTNRLTMRSPQIQVTMDGPSQIAIGIPQGYRVLVSNVDRQRLEGLVMRLEVPAGIRVTPQSPTHGQCQIEVPGDGARLLTWVFQHLDQNGQAVLPLELTAESSTDFSISVEWTLQPITAVAALQVLSPKLEMALEGPRDVRYGQPNAYRLNIKNPGTADARDVNIKLSAQHYGSSSATIARIAAGTEESMEVELIFNHPGAIKVAAEAQATGNLTSKSELQVLVRQAQLDLFWDAPEVAFHGTAVPYTLRLKNSGDAPAEELRTVIEIPANARLESLPPSTTVENGALIWEVPLLSPGSLADLNFQIAFTGEGGNQLSARCSQSTGNPVQSSAQTLVQSITDLKLLVSDPVAPAVVGGEVVYELNLVNRGSKVAEEVNVIALFSKDIEPVRAEGHPSQLYPGQVRFDPLAAIRPGETVQLRVYAVAELSGMHRFRAEVHTANSEIKLAQEETTQFIDAIRRTANSGASLPR